MTQPQPTDLVLGGNRPPRRTKKYISALDVAQSLSLSVPPPPNSELYLLLQQHGFYWDSEAEIWNRAIEINPPSTVLKMRLVFDGRFLDAHCQMIKSLLSDAGYQVLEASKFYPRRPPEINDSSVYLTILPPSD